ncbi:MAG: hypothetical protein ACI8W8_000747 [Rhodothermales bacterium]
MALKGIQIRGFVDFATAGGEECARRYSSAMPDTSDIDLIAEQLATNRQLRRRFQRVAASGAMLLLLVLGVFVGRLAYIAWTYDSSQLQALVTEEGKRVAEIEKKFWQREWNHIKEHDLPILWNELLTKLEQEQAATDAVSLLRTLSVRPRYALADAVLAGIEKQLPEEPRELLMAELRTPQNRERLAEILGSALDESRAELSTAEVDALTTGLVDGIVTLLTER